MAISRNLLNDGEHVVVSTRTHPKVMFVPLMVLLLSLAAATFLQGMGGDGPAGTVLHVGAWAVAAVLIVWWALRPFVLWVTTTYTFTNRRFMKRAGLIAKTGRTIPLNRISGVDFEIGVIDRIFGCGTLVVSDASELGRVELHDIPRVEHVQLLVAEELHRISEGTQSDDGT
ncbi:PH domain-containing protein [Nocardioides donggukensis]|uniref:PH domain-containing protein n=1 Tax=Nocardioides donggukensis TaxID=2774019 RepID=A0A927K6G6_9ACTN|nr:PH domain-containing protein [Nocardioides donggukensis]MBD8868706.1 PH domain-containing protein [Nocardioides donggukensis]